MARRNPHFDEVPDLVAWPRRTDSFPSFAQGLTLEGLEGWLESLRVTARSAIEWQCTARWRLGPRVIGDSMYFLILNGTGTGSVEEQTFAVGTGDLVLIPRGLSHDMVQDPGQLLRVAAVHFDADVFGRLNLLDLLGFPAHIPADRATQESLQALTGRVLREFATAAPGHRVAGSALVTEVLFLLLRHHGPLFTPPYRGGRMAELRRLMPAFDYLERNLGDGTLGVGDLAARVHLSEVRFRKLFLRAVGLSPARYIQRRRVEQACRLLRGSDDSIEQVAAACGFSDAPFFSRVFKKWIRSTPARYRREGV